MRRDFRTEVDAPRPASAWVMVTVASATLWITQQLDVWALALQASALLASLWRRSQPLRLQRSPLALNLGMIGIVAGTVVVASRGEPSTVALAHFAALTQGLQLLDARPRRTEFLLVALALFQVVLAANLTDSVFFTPLLVAFLLATVWTLLVHTLRSEALEAGEVHELPRAFTPGLLRTTLLASGLSVLLALVLFVVLPRMRSSVVSGSQLGGTLATAGFSETVQFGELGRIRQDPTVVLRVETLSGEALDPKEAYWRGLAFDSFDGTSWSITPAQRRRVPGTAESGIELGRSDDSADLEQRIVREPVSGGVLFAVGTVRAIQGTIRRLERDQSGGLYGQGQAEERVRYTVRTERPRWRLADLADDRVAPPARNGARYLQRPGLGPELGELARRISAGARNDAERVRAIERYLLANGRYTDIPPSPEPGDPRTPVERFLLGELSGHCEYFASGMVLLAREIGIPARLVNGFAGGHENRIGGFVELTRSDAHAWVEVHYEKAGWVRYDPTPADLRMRPEAARSLAFRLRELGSALELWWFQRVVGFDRSDQMSAIKSAWLAWRGRLGPRSADGARARQRIRSRGLGSDLPWREGALVALSVGAAGSALLALVRRRRRRDGPPRAYARALRRLAGRGLARDASTPARDFAAAVERELPTPAAAAFSRLTELYLAERFGGRGPQAAESALRDFERALARSRS